MSRRSYEHQLLAQAIRRKAYPSMSASRGYVWNTKLGHPSDLDWGLAESNTPPKIEEEGSSWSCGNPKKRKQLVERFAQTSSVHGTHFICSKKNTSCLLKVIYRVLFFLCILSVISNVTVLLLEAFDKESTFINSINKDIELGKEEDPDYFPDYPRITLCRKPFFKSELNESFSELVEYSYLALGYPFIPFSPEEVSLIVEISVSEQTSNLSAPAAEFRKYLDDMDQEFQRLKNSSKNFNLTNYIHENSVRCDEFFLYCLALVFPLNCCDIFRPVLTSMGLCYALRDHGDILELIRESPIEFSVVIDLTSPPHLNRSTEEGFNVFLTDPQEEAILFQPSEGQKIVPGLVTTVNAQLVKTERNALHRPWHGLTESCPRFPFGDDPPEQRSQRYSYRTCDTYTYFLILREACHCESVFFPGTPTLRLCEPRDLYICFMSATITKNFTDIFNVCYQPCLVYKYRSEASYIGLGGENISRLEIMYNSKQFIFHEYRTTTMSSLFSQIGGSLGLYLGASIITVVEILTFVASWLWYRICPSRTSSSKVRQDTTALHRHAKGNEHYYEKSEYF
ncbi:uncharacterized protein NPIL_627351 [Nephila pilipes]|uniref:Sodium channel protein Nach n=1 Tax=Nephila pilipes TaxID=299642 RepID=A0A8X6TB11_NEPPI|nr:uncharacterized protein NPIL_627351 [Nephila pilipes]